MDDATGVLERRLAAVIDREQHRWVGDVLERIGREVSGLVESSERATLAEASTRGLLDDFASWLRVEADDRSVRAPPAALGFARHLAREGVPLADLLRAYRLGQELVFAATAQLAAEAGDIAVMSRVGLMTFRYVDGVTAEITNAFEREREAYLHGALARRDRLVAELLAGTFTDVGAAERTLGRRLSGQHLAVVAWQVDASDDPEPAAEALRALLDTLGTGRPLILLGAAGDAFGWATPGEHRPQALDTQLADGLRDAGVRAAVGLPASGREGFISSRRQADAARRITHLLPDHTVVHYADVALLSFLLRDPPAAADFAREQLGALFDPAPRFAVLRDTLATYLARGANASSAAEALGLHRNTIARRLARAEQLLGYPIDERPNELSVALTIARSIRRAADV